MVNTAEAMSTRFLEILTDGASLTALCELTAGLCGVPVSITLPTRTLIAHSADYSEELLREYTDHMLLATDEELTARVCKIDEQLSTRKAVIGTYPFMKYRHLNCGCFYGNVMIGVLDCPITAHVDRQRLIEIAEFSAPVFASAMYMHGYMSDMTDNAMQVYIMALINGRPQEWYQMHNIYEPPIERVHSWRIMWSPAIGEAWAQQRRHDLEWFCQHHERVWFAEYNGGAVVLFDADGGIDIRKLADCCGKISPVSVSETFEDLRILKEHLHAAQTSLRLAAFEDRNAQIVFVHEYKMAMGYLYLKQIPSPMNMVHPAVTEIKKYDAEHGNEYFLTLRAYLLCGRDYARMAKHLHIHKNTVSYRMQRMVELFDLDLKDCRLITALYLSLFADYEAKS